MGDARRPLSWVASALYLAVLTTGVYFDAAGLSAAHRGLLARAGFLGGLAILLAIEVVEHRRGSAAGSRRTAIALLGVRMALFEAVNAVDGAGLARALYLLVPFFAYLSLGRRISYGLAALYLAAAVARGSLSPGWHRDPEIVSDLLMFAIGMVLSVSMAAVAAEQTASRVRAELLLDDLSASHDRLAAYAGQAAELAAATERNRLARDIHDSLGHHLTAVAVQLEKAAVFRDLDPATATQAVADARRATGLALDEVRRSVGTLRGGPFSLATAVGALVDGLRDGGFEIDLTVSGAADGYHPAALTALYRAAQEGLTNARRHAGADRVEVVVDLGAQRARLTVTDNGRGFAAAQPVPTTTGHGLAGMRERIDAVGGSMRIEPAPGRGTRLAVTVPRTVADQPTGSVEAPA